MNPQELASQLRKPSGQFGLQTGKMMNDGNKPMHDLTYQVMNLQEGEKVLELGFGNGKFISPLIRERGILYTGVDYSELMVKVAIDFNKEFVDNGSAKILHGNLSELPFPSHTFDVVFTINTLYFWENPAKDILELKRVLKPGGRIFITIRPKHLVQNFEFAKHGFTLYEKEDVVLLLQEAGFKELSFKEQEDPEMDMQGQKVTLKSIVVSGKNSTPVFF